MGNNINEISTKIVHDLFDNIVGSFDVCSFTGHRKIKNDDIPMLTRMLDEVVEGLILRGCKIFCTGGALGFDTMAALSVIKQRAKYTEKNIKLNLIMPYPQQSEKWSQNEIITYEFIKEHASNFKYLHSKYSEGAISERNHELVDACDILVCYCRTLRSGTGATVNYAKRCDKFVVNLSDFLGLSFL